MLRYLHFSEPPSSDPAENKVIFVDRDGVINVDLIGDYIKSWDEFLFEACAIDALKRLTDAGFRIIIVSNQAGVGDGIFSETALRSIHERMIQALQAEGIQIFSSHYCLHGKQAGCKCRKPETGLFEDAAKNISFIKSRSYFIGDKKTDVEAGKRFGLKTAFIRTGHGKADETKLTPQTAPDLRADNFLEAVQQILSQ